jgi:RND family efflux transporter MFP subunit
MKKKIIYSIIIIFGLILGWQIILLITAGDPKQAARSGRTPVAVEIDSVRFGPLKELRQLTGTVYPIYQYIVAPKISGRIVTIHKRIGDWVQAGEIIAQLDDAEYQQGVLEAEANLRIAEASLREAQIQLDQAGQEKERVESLQAKGIASPAELDAAVSNYSAQQSRQQLAQAQVQQRKASLKAANIRLGYTILTADQAGFIGERFVDEGTLLAPNAPVVSVIGINTVVIRTTIIERDYGHIQIGMPAVVRVDAFPNLTFSGKVSRIAPLLQEASRVAQAEVEVSNNPPRLKPGMFARVDVVTAERVNTQIVLSQAVVSRSGSSGIFIVDPDTAAARYIPVNLGIVTPQFTEILSPKIEGMVITLGQHLLDDGSPILLPKAASKPDAQTDTSTGKQNL